ncbi:cell wall-binding repeat-containing protein [Streptomyces sp. NPDC086783]|uniref:cell wall-binding repeat-containing protein n=1 Tax=Streptomyces sp. NPDC086783 TaxID=3365758 RepID=UPI0037FE378F
MLVNPVTGAVTQVGTYRGYYAAWAPDGSRIISEAGQLASQRPDGSSRFSLPWAEGVRSSAEQKDITFWWGGRYVVYSTGGQLVYGPSDASWAPKPLLSAAQEPSTVCDEDPTVSPNGLVAFSRRINYGCYDNDGVWIYDSSAKTIKRVLTDAAQPAFSPDGTKLAFVRHVDGGFSQLFTANADGTNVKQITTDGRGYANPSWSPTGTRIIADVHTAGDSRDVHTTEYVDVATGATTAVPGTPQGSNPSWQPLRNNSAGRVWGSDAYASNIASSRWTWNTYGGTKVPGLMDAQAAVLINRDSPSYALTAPALAGKKHGPVLATTKSGLTTAVKNELKRTLRPGSNVYLIGGTSILTSTVSSQITSLGFTPKRLSGTDRYATSIAVAKSVTSSPKYVFLATGTDYHSALAAASAAGADGTSSAGSVVLNNGNSLTSSVRSYLNSLNPKTTMIVTVGSSAKYALTHTNFSNWPSTYSYYPITASTNEATSVALAKFWWTAPSTVALSYTNSWRGGVCAGAAMNVFGPVLWTSKDSLTSEVKSYLLRESASTNSVTAFGGTGSVSKTALDTAGAAISASATQFVYHPYYNGVVDTAAQQSTYVARTNGGQPATVARTGPTGADPHLDSLETVQHQ